MGSWGRGHPHRLQKQGRLLPQEVQGGVDEVVQGWDKCGRQQQDGGGGASELWVAGAEAQQDSHQLIHQRLVTIKLLILPVTVI